MKQPAPAASSSLQLMGPAAMMLLPVSFMDSDLQADVMGKLGITFHSGNSLILDGQEPKRESVFAHCILASKIICGLKYKKSMYTSFL